MHHSGRFRSGLWPGLGITAWVLATAGCAGRPYRFETVGSVDFLARAETQSAGGLRVSAAVPSAEESEALFGAPLYEHGIQPVWLEIENGTDARVRFAPRGTDSEYFSSLEVAYMHRRLFSRQGQADMERRLYESAMTRQIWPGEKHSGFVFTHLRPGTKAFNVDLHSAAGGHRTFTFFVDVPGFLPDHAEIDFDALYEPREIVRTDEAGLRGRLSELGCCTTDSTGTAAGLPLNLVLVGMGEGVLQALLRAGWYERPRAETPAMLAKEQYWKGRPPDAVFRTRRTRGDRDELRVWMAPLVVGDVRVWVAQVTHYIGRATELGRALFDPRLDPDLDEARRFMVQNLWYGQGLRAWAFQRAGPAVPISDPRKTFEGVRYFTDGLRAVLWVSGSPVSQAETAVVHWDDPRNFGKAP